MQIGVDSVSRLPGIAFCILLLAQAASAQLAVHAIPLRSPAAGAKLLSANGTTVVGVTDDGAPARWRLGTGVSDIGQLLTYGTNETGDQVCGVADGIAVRWSAWSGVEEVGAHPGYGESWAFGISSHGVAGQLVQSSSRMAAVHRGTSGWQVVPLPAEAIWSVAVDISGGGIVAGNWQRPGGSMGAFWSFWSMTTVLSGPDGSQAWVWDVSPTGNPLVGMVPIAGEPFVIGIPHRACVWWLSGAPSVLRLLPNTQRSEALASSDWGRVVVGTSYGDTIGSRATAWVGGVPIDLTRYLECAGIATPTLNLAIGVSSDGLTILSQAIGLDRLYLITGFTPPTGPVADLNWDGNTDGVDLGLLLSAWGPCPSPCDADLNQDGAVDGNDLAQLLAKWGSCY